jgi:hypothetical protein
VTYPVQKDGQPAGHGRRKARTLRNRGCGIRGLAGLGRATLFVAAALPLLASAVFAKGPAQNEVTREFAKTVTLSGTQGVSLDHRFGRVTIHGQGGREVKIAATIRAQDSNPADAQSFLEKIQIEVREEGDGVHIRTIYPESRLPHIRIGGHSSFSVDYDIAMPAEAPLWMRNAFGNAAISGVRGWSQLENSNGALEVRDAGGAKLVNAFGKIELTNASGNCSITNNNGAVNVSNVKGTLELRNRFGEIVAAQIGGAATISGGNARVSLTQAGGNSSVSNSFGEVVVRNISGSLTVTNSNGRIDVAEVSGSAELATSFGSVEATRIGGTATIRDSNGAVHVTDVQGFVSATSSFGTVKGSQLFKGANVVTGNGSIELSNVQGEVFAKTSFGSIYAENVKGKFTAQDSNGSVTAKNVEGDANVTTSFSGVSLEAVGGRITVENQNGAVDVTASGSGCQDVSIRTSFSHIGIRLPAARGYRIKAKTSFGRIHSELPITASGAMGGDSLEGTIGNGGCTLDLTNSNGNIDIAKQ